MINFGVQNFRTFAIIASHESVSILLKGGKLVEVSLYQAYFVRTHWDNSSVNPQDTVWCKSNKNIF